MLARRRARLILIPVLWAISACGSSTGTTPTASATLTSDKFTGTLNANGGVSFPFVTTSAAGGAIAATVTSLDPDPSAVMGLALGNWNGTSCALVFTNDAATTGTVVSANASGPASLCARVYDTGHLGDPVNFLVTISHPQ